MKRLLTVLIAAAFLATGSMVAIAADVIVLPAKNGNVTFDHKAHQGRLECKACHEGTPAKITLDKDSAHKLCKSCHQAKGGAAPTKCGDCHKK